MASARSLRDPSPGPVAGPDTTMTAFPRVTGPGNITMRLDLSPALADELEGLARATGGTIPEVFLKAISLFKIAVEAHSEGKAIGIASPGGALESEIVGIDSEPVRGGHGDRA